MIPLQHICDQFELGTALKKPEVVQGGTMHQLWRLSTERGDFALKCLNTRNRPLLGSQQLSVDQAQRLLSQLSSQGVATHHTLSHPSGYELLHNNQAWAVYRWVDGDCILPSQLSVHHARKIGELLAQLHQAKPLLEKLNLPTWHGLSDEECVTAINAGISANLSWVDIIQKNSANLVRWSEIARCAVQKINTKVILSHRDIHIYNVIWTSEENPVLIDWELGGLIDPQVELFITAMNWSYRDGALIEPAFTAVFDAYSPEGKIDLSVLRDAYRGYLLDWLIFNLRRSIAEPAQDMIAVNEIRYVIAVLQFIDTCPENYFSEKWSG